MRPDHLTVEELERGVPFIKAGNRKNDLEAVLKKLLPDSVKRSEVVIFIGSDNYWHVQLLKYAHKRPDMWSTV